MKYSGSKSALNLKLALLAIGAVIALGTLFYTQNLVSKLQDRERKIVELYANSYEFLTNSDDVNSDFTFIFENIILRIDFPIIVTDSNDIILPAESGGGYKNIYFDENISQSEKVSELQKKLSELKNLHPSINVKAPDGKILQKIFYGDSDVINQLKYYPYLQILFAILFIIIAYSSFNYIRKNEQSNIWVGMSKETAHQLGTPISSLMGWTEILSMNYNHPDKVLDTTEEIKNDLNRLNKITNRFSKIGSQPELTNENPYQIIQKVIKYFDRRLPQLGKNVIINLNGRNNLNAKLNSELFEWVIENLIKNALDAVETKQGKIDLNVNENKKMIEIEITDNGKGIDHNKWKDIFRPGYSTKRRGWGLGLSLSKRIIENYHKGKIFVKNSELNVGTTFKILLNRSTD